MPENNQKQSERWKWRRAWTWLVLFEITALVITSGKIAGLCNGVVIHNRHVPYFVIIGSVCTALLVIAFVVFLVSFTRSKGEETRQLSLIISFPIITLSTFIIIFAELYKWAGIKYTGSEQLTITNFEYVYFSMITMTTVGYGDFVPGDQFGRAIAAFEALSGYVVLAALVTALSYIGRRDT